MTIKIDGYTFQGPFSDTDQLEDRSGVYAIFCPTGDNRYKVIDVGEASEVKSRVESHDRRSCWEQNCPQITYGAHYTPGLQQSGRREVEQHIRSARSVPCGER